MIKLDQHAFHKFIDEDILKSFEEVSAFHHDLIMIQLSRDLKNLTKTINEGPGEEWIRRFKMGEGT